MKNSADRGRCACNKQIPGVSHSLVTRSDYLAFFFSTYNSQKVDYNFVYPWDNYVDPFCKQQSQSTYKQTTLRKSHSTMGSLSNNVTATKISLRK